MASVNRVFLMGNLTRDPEIRYTPSGKAVADISMAINRKFKSATGELKEETCYVNVNTWGRQAETAGEYLSKGSSIFVEGRLQFDSWEKDGQKHNRLKVVADRIQFMSSKGGRTGGDEGGASASRETPAAAPKPAEAPTPPPAADDDDLPF